MPLAAIVMNFMDGWVEGEVYDPVTWAEADLDLVLVGVSLNGRSGVKIITGGLAN